MKLDIVDNACFALLATSDFVISHPFWLHTNFRIVFSRSVKCAFDILIGTALNLCKV